MSVNSNQTLKTLSDVLLFMSSFAGGSVPDATDQEYVDWVRWVGMKQEEYALRAFWRRCLTRVSITLDGETTLLPDRFHKHNGIYVLEVDGVDWAEHNNSDGQEILVEMDGDPLSANFGKWQVRFSEEVDNVSAVLWYFANPPRPTLSADIVLLPGDMIGYAALGEYFRTTGAEGSQDKAESDAENRFQEYLSLEMIPPKYELLSFKDPGHVNRTAQYRSYYRRTGRNRQ
jgi:hypothetical protein